MNTRVVSCLLRANRWIWLRLTALNWSILINQLVQASLMFSVTLSLKWCWIRLFLKKRDCNPSQPWEAVWLYNSSLIFLLHTWTRVHFRVRSLYFYFSPEGGSQARLLFWLEGLQVNYMATNTFIHPFMFYIFSFWFVYFKVVFLLETLNPGNVRWRFARITLNHELKVKCMILILLIFIGPRTLQCMRYHLFPKSYQITCMMRLPGQ